MKLGSTGMRSSQPSILIMCRFRRFLSELLGYFEEGAVGYVQAAQAYYNQRASFIARGAAEETYDYYSSTQMAAYAIGQPAVVGCHNVHRMAALREVGGFAAHDADDLALSMQYHAHGWRGVYVPRILARGLTPVDWNGYLKQQLRWARSVVDVRLRLHRLLGKNPVACGAVAGRSPCASAICKTASPSSRVFCCLHICWRAGDVLRIGGSAVPEVDPSLRCASGMRLLPPALLSGRGRARCALAGSRVAVRQMAGFSLGAMGCSCGPSSALCSDSQD